jgi:hypothetical protein
MNESSITESAPAVEELNFESNLFLGLVGGGVAMLISAILWGTITYFTEYQISWMAIGVGFFVGFAVNRLGKGNTLIYGISAAVLSLVGCILGNFLFYNGILAKEWEVPFFDVLFAILLQPEAILEIFIVAFDFMDLLFYGIAAYVGFRMATSEIKSKTQHWNETS